jgi:hypothetical protein
MVLRWVAFVAGVAVLASTIGSIVGTLVVTRGIRSHIARACATGVDAGFALITKPARGYVRRDQILAWQAPATCDWACGSACSCSATGSYSCR